MKNNLKFIVIATVVLVLFVNSFGFAQQASEPITPQDVTSFVNQELKDFPGEDMHDCQSPAGKVFDSCVAYYVKKWDSYGAIILTGIYGLFVPPVAEVALAEFVSKVGKDGAKCVLIALVESVPSDPRDKKLAKAAVEALLEGYDLHDSVTKIKDYGKAKEELQKFLKKDKNADMDKAKFAKFAHLKLYERAFGVKKYYGATHEVLEWIGGPDIASYLSLQDAKQQIDRCDFEVAERSIRRAIFEGAKSLRTIRSIVAYKRRSLYCVIEQNKVDPAPTSLGGPEGEIGRARSTVQSWEQKDKEQVEYLRSLDQMYGGIHSKRDALAGIRTNFAKWQTEAETAFNTCNQSEWTRVSELVQKASGYACADKLANELKSFKNLEKKWQTQWQETSEKENLLKQAFDAADRSTGDCQNLEDAIHTISGFVKSNRCLNMVDAQVKATTLQNKIDASKNATEELHKTLPVIQGHITNCDAIAATTMIDYARGLVAKRACVPSGQGVSGMGEIKALETAKDDLNTARQKVLKSAADILSDAQRAGENCDEVRLQAASEQLAIAAQEFSAFCKTPPPEVTNALNTIRELMKKGYDKEEATKIKAAIEEGKEALKACDVMGAMASADEVEFVGKSCVVDGPLEAQNIRAAAASIAKMQEALIQNVATLRDRARTGWTGACDFAAVRAAHSEIFRITEPFLTKCPEYPPGIDTDVAEVEKIFKSAEQQVVAEREISDLYQQAKTAWNQCKPAVVKQLIDDLRKVQRPNSYCSSLSQMADPLYADALKFGPALGQMINSIDNADQLLESCPTDFKPVEQELKKAEMQIAEIQKSQMSCDLREPLAVIAQIRKDARDVETSRKTIADKLKSAMNLFNQEQTDEAKKLRNEASQLLTNASPQECFEDLSASLDNLDFLTDAEEQGEDPFGGVEEQGEDPFGGVEELPEDDPEVPDDDPIELVEIPEDGEDPVDQTGGNTVDQNKGTTVSFTGTWKSSYGTLTLSQGGNSVSGSSDYYSTQVNGTIKEDGKLHFTWSDSNNKKGVGVFELSSDGQSFSGSWSYLLSDGKTLGLGGTWGGRRIN